MIEVYPNLWVGNRQGCSIAQLKDFDILHAAKTCHQGFLGYVGRMNHHDPQYLVALGATDLYLNLVDAPFEPSVAIVESAMGWLMLNHYELNHKVLIHCDQGISRAPTLALLYLNRREMYDAAKFKKVYPLWEPMEGMQKTLERYGVKL